MMPKRVSDHRRGSVWLLGPSRRGQAQTLEGVGRRMIGGHQPLHRTNQASLRRRILQRRRLAGIGGEVVEPAQ
jgi:hypothetical protein